MSLEPAHMASWPAAERIPLSPEHVLYKAQCGPPIFTEIRVVVCADRDPGALFVRRRVINDYLWLDLIDAADVVYKQQVHSLAAFDL